MKKIMILISLMFTWLFSFENIYNYADMKADKDQTLSLKDKGYDIVRESLKEVDGIYQFQVYITESQEKGLKTMGFNPQVIIDPRTKEEKMKGYHTNETIGIELDSLEKKFPDICKRLQLGTSVEGRPLWAVKISDNVELDEAEPEFKYVSTMHGDEPTGEEMCMLLVKDLLDGYDAGIDTMQFLVNNTEIFIMPLMNPDGMVAQSYNNANNIDLNKNFPEWTYNDSNSVVGREPEVAAIIKWNNERNFVLSANFHEGIILVNYPWDSAPGIPSGEYAACPDDATFIWLSRGYADRNPDMTIFDNGITNGSDWYSTQGGMQDWNYFYYNDMDVIVEVANPKWPDYSIIPDYWASNRSSMYWYLSAIHTGIKGVIRDSATGQPLKAGISIEGIDKTIFSNEVYGDYYRILKPGVYSMLISSDGYNSKYISNIDVFEDSNATVVNVQLEPVGTDTTPPVAGILNPSFAQINNNLEFQLSVFDNSEIEYVKGVWNVNALQDTILLARTKDFKTYSGSIPAQSAVCLGTIKFLMKDEYGNDSISHDYQIQWRTGRIENFETGDFSFLSWNFSGDAGWEIDNSNPFSGGYCSRSFDIGDDQTAEMYVKMNYILDGYISFYIKTSTEPNFDPLIFYIDGVKIDQWTVGTLDWTYYKYPVTIGEHTFKWSYEKDYMESGGDDFCWLDDIYFDGGIPSSINDGLMINSINLYQNYPNPFNPTTEINFSLNHTQNINLSVFNSKGELVQTLFDGKKNKGLHSIGFDASRLNSGIYFYKLTVEDYSITRKMLFLK